MSNNELLIPNASWYHYIGTSQKNYDIFFQLYILDLVRVRFLNPGFQSNSDKA